MRTAAFDGVDFPRVIVGGRSMTADACPGYGGCLCNSLPERRAGFARDD
jgi:hypothetical protein